MAPTLRRQAGAHADPPLSDNEKRLLARFSQLVREKIKALARGPDRQRLIKLADQAVLNAQQSFARGDEDTSGPDRLPITKLKAADVLAQGWVDLSQASLYRAAEQGRFYCTVPSGRSIGKEFPVWQFMPPVPELIGPILALFAGKPSSEIHIFWVCAVDEFNELSPAEVVAGKPFETRGELHSSQQALLEVPSVERAYMVAEWAKWKTRGNIRTDRPSHGKPAR